MKLFYIVIIFLVTGCVSVHENQSKSLDNQVKSVELKEVIDNQDIYHNKNVIVHGYISYGFENCTIMPNDIEHSTKEDYQNYTIWYWNEDCMTQTKDFNYGFALLYGTYDKNNKGHLFAYNSSFIINKIVWL